MKKILAAAAIAIAYQCIPTPALAGCALSVMIDDAHPARQLPAAAFTYLEDCIYDYARRLTAIERTRSRVSREYAQTADDCRRIVQFYNESALISDEEIFSDGLIPRQMDEEVFCVGGNM